MNFSKLSACCLFQSLSENSFQHTGLPVAHKNQRSQVSIHESRTQCSHTHLARSPSLAVLCGGGGLPHIPPALWDTGMSVLSRRDTLVSSCACGVRRAAHCSVEEMGFLPALTASRSATWISPVQTSPPRSSRTARDSPSKVK